MINRVFYILLCLFFFSCSESKIVPELSNDSLKVDLQPDQISFDVEVIFVDSSFTKAILHAERARIYQSKMETILDGGIMVEFLSRTSGKIVSRLTADSAKIDDRTKDMFAGGNVIVYSDSTKTKLETSVLEWSNETQKLYSTEYVKITSPYETIRGYGFESDQHLVNYKVFRMSGEQKQK